MLRATQAVQSPCVQTRSLTALEIELPIFKQARFALTAAALTLASGAALAQQTMPGQMPNLAALSGQMHAAAEYCNAYPAAQLEQMKQQQKTATSAQGMSAADFDTAFSQSYGQAKTQLGALSAADKEKTCAQLKAMAAAQPR